MTAPPWCRAKCPHKIDGLEWVRGWDLDFREPALHLLREGEFREDTDDQDASGAIVLIALFSYNQVDAGYEGIVTIDSTPPGRCPRNSAGPEPLELSVFSI